MSEDFTAPAADENLDEEASGIRRSFLQRPPKGVLLDLDGTLLDRTDAHAHAWLEALAGEGTALPYSTIRKQIGRGGEELLWSLLRVPADSIIGQTITRHRRRIFRTFYLPKVAPFPETRLLLQRMRHEGMTLQVVTSSAAPEVDDLLRAAWVADLVQRRPEEPLGPPAKPADVFRDAVERSGLAKEDLLMLGDTPYAVSSARAVGIGIVALRSGGWSDRELVGATAIYDDPADLLQRWDDSPFARPLARAATG